MKFLLWLINIPWRHYRDARRYERGGVGQRVFSIIFITVLAAGAICLEYFSLNMLLNEGQLIGILLIIAAVPFALATVELCGVYSFFGFKTAVAGTLSGWINKAASKKGKTETIAETAEAQSEQAKNEKRKCPKGLEIFVGIYFAVLAVLVVVMMFAVINLFQ